MMFDLVMFFLFSQGYVFVLLLSNGPSSWSPSRDVAIAEIVNAGGSVVDLPSVAPGTKKAIAVAPSATPVHPVLYDAAVSKGMIVVAWVSLNYQWYLCFHRMTGTTVCANKPSAAASAACRQCECLAQAGRGMRASRSDTRASSQAFERTHIHEGICRTRNVSAVYRDVVIAILHSNHCCISFVLQYI